MMEIFKGEQDVKVTGFVITDAEGNSRTIHSSVSGGVLVDAYKLEHKLEEILNALERIVIHLAILSGEEINSNDVQ